MTELNEYLLQFVEQKERMPAANTSFMLTKKLKAVKLMLFFFMKTNMAYFNGYTTKCNIKMKIHKEQFTHFGKTLTLYLLEILDIKVKQGSSKGQNNDDKSDAGSENNNNNNNDNSDGGSQESLFHCPTKYKLGRKINKLGSPSNNNNYNYQFSDNNDNFDNDNKKRGTQNRAARNNSYMSNSFSDENSPSNDDDNEAIEDIEDDDEDDPSLAAKKARKGNRKLSNLLMLTNDVYERKKREKSASFRISQRRPSNTKILNFNRTMGAPPKMPYEEDQVILEQPENENLEDNREKGEI